MSAAENLRATTVAMSAVIVNYNGRDDLSRCVAALLRDEPAIEIVIVDNGSHDEGLAQARIDHQRLRVISDGTNYGFAGGANRGAAAASGEFLFFLNPDVFVEPGCVSTLRGALSAAPASLICAPVIRDLSGTRVEYGFTVDWVGDLVSLKSEASPLYVSGCAFAISRQLFSRLGGFDDAYFMFCEDLDLCWRALLSGGDVRVIPDAAVKHRGGGSTPGGYVRHNRIQVTSFRLALRERNALATLAQCGPLAWLLAAIPVRLTRIFVAILWALLTGRLALARDLVEGIAWNIRRLPHTVRTRRAMRVSSTMRRRVLLSRVLHDVVALRVLVRHGLPQFVDDSAV